MTTHEENVVWDWCCKGCGAYPCQKETDMCPENGRETKVTNPLDGWWPEYVDGWLPEYEENPRSTSKKKEKSKVTKPNVEFLLERRALVDRAIERAVLTAERFGDDEDYEDGFIFVAERKFNSTGVAYTYVFLKVRNGCWYSTSHTRSHTCTWSQLIDFLSECERVDYVSALEEI